MRDIKKCDMKHTFL